VLVSDGKGGVGVVRQGALIGGMMPSGMTAARAGVRGFGEWCAAGTGRSRSVAS
jgi:hypothetical protein